MDLRAELAMRDAELAEARAEIERLRQLLFLFVGHEDEPCYFDHHGYCQEHPGAQDIFQCAVSIARQHLGLDPKDAPPTA